jgi:outer membrane protein TolC
MKLLWMVAVWLLALDALAAPLTLDQAYQKALARSEALQITEEQEKFAKGRYDEAFSAIFPQINLSASELFRNSQDGFGNEGGIVPSGSRRRFRSSVSFTQPIFRGFREFLLADAAKFELSAAAQLIERRKQELFLEVATSYEQLRLNRADLKVLARTMETLGERIRELGEWVKLGKSKASEISAAEAERADLAALVEQVKGAEAAATEYLTFYLGDEASDYELTGPRLIPASSTLEQYVLKGRERADIRASANQLASLTKQVSVASRERLPAINLSGNYYPYQDPDSAQDWDISVSLQVPLFDAGRISSRVSQQEALRRQGELNLQQLYRIAERDIRSSYAQLVASRAREKSLATLVADAEKSYESQRADYKLGIVTNIDVLQAIRQVEDAKRRLLAAGVESHINSIKLAVASGDLSL